MRQKYVITAGLNKVSRQRYIISYDDDPQNWSISVVPYPMSKTRCLETIAKVKKDMKEKSESLLFKTKYENMSFEIVEWNE